ncbi:MAG TPA: copper resistance protein NlpE [Candidatus Moranbacteria bacterium]|nr:copper resistance protein NlpE [Candidatus Moranbacteria bacterium]
MKSKKWWLVSLPAVAIPLVLSGCNKKEEMALVEEDVLPSIAEEIELDPIGDDGVEEIEVTADLDGNAARDVIDWAGVYKGTLPCASCEGIETEITLNEDGTYTQKESYITTKPGGGEVDIEKGTFAWDITGTKITLVEDDDKNETDNDDQKIYLVTEGQIQALDYEGKIITGELANDYILKKQQ